MWSSSSGGNGPGPGTQSFLAFTAPVASILLEGGVDGPCLHLIFCCGHRKVVGYC